MQATISVCLLIIVITFYYYFKKNYQIFEIDDIFIFLPLHIHRFIIILVTVAILFMNPVLHFILRAGTPKFQPFSVFCS